LGVKEEELLCLVIGDWYRARWEIELFFHVLKNGCRVEALQLSSVERLERAVRESTRKSPRHLRAS
jgi:hypothetical protein